MKFITNLPISLFAPYIVDFGLVILSLFASIPTNCLVDLSLFFTNVTADGVVRAPSEFSITRGPVPSYIATQLFVVPKSISAIIQFENDLRNE